jgi:Concanavalin A-like lectin/glucanases superfamily
MNGILSHRGLLLSAEPAILTYEQQVLADSPVAYYRLNETSGTTATKQGSGGANGTYQNAFTLNQTGFTADGKSVLLAGTGSEGTASGIDCNFSTDYVSALSLECFFNATPGGSKVNACLITKSSYFAFGVNDFPVSLIWNEATETLSLVASIGNDFSQDIVLSEALSEGVDYHAAAVIRGSGTCDLLVNGVIVQSGTIAGNLSTTSQTWKIGKALENGGGAGLSSFSGRIAEVAIYAAALSEARFAAHYAARSI